MAQPNARTLGEGGSWFAEVLAKGLATAVEAMTGRTLQFKWTSFEGALSEGLAAGSCEWWEQSITAGPGCKVWVCAPEETWNAIGALALAAAGIDDATPEDCSGTWREIQAQGLSSAAQELARRARKDISCEGGKMSVAPADARCAVDIVLEAPEAFRLRCVWNENLQKVLEPEEERKPAAAAASATPSSPAAVEAAPAKGVPSSIQNSRTLDLLLEVDLPICVSFGRVQLPLKDVLKLNSGSIVELNRSISEPVEVIVNNCVIARGEVVVVEGNYGVRIKQIISKEERLRTLY